jgi:hypothetical protein
MSYSTYRFVASILTSSPGPNADGTVTRKAFSLQIVRQHLDQRPALWGLYWKYIDTTSCNVVCSAIFADDEAVRVTDHSHAHLMHEILGILPSCRVRVVPLASDTTNRLYFGISPSVKRSNGADYGKCRSRRRTALHILLRRCIAFFGPR